ncbi:CDP-diacylglycerol--glycerol-3-phosphate 3-phosphatidyltransferase [Lentisphaerota bacterium ZTH]|nr:CDP-diacylglycerol--glycerol-3-phosphate 3-phosphatidyltransferase [Lentisphaerota bacterium]WET05793.1 CDP-diacylglycerol--glycerol-3-phosphate 3-phosphatidyltransferase [Lentisphaerota bacterium ZTH]
MNFANTLTVARIVLIYIFMILAANADGEIGPGHYGPLILRIIAFVVALFAAFTDLADGYIARKYNQVTDFGKLMDPLADKIFMTATMLMVVEFELMPAWIVVVIISREFLVTGLRMLAVQKGEVIAADGWGKAKTFMQMIMIFIAGLSWLTLFNLRTDMVLGFKLWSIWSIYLWIIAAITVWSGMGYFVKYRHLYLGRMN